LRRFLFDGCLPDPWNANQLLTKILAKYGIEYRSGLALHGRKHVRIYVQGQARRGMAETIGHDFWMNAGRRHQGRMSVPQDVRADSPDPGSL